MTQVLDRQWFNPGALGSRDATTLVDHSVAVIGAGSGIGRAVAARLSRAGGLVTCLDVDPDGCEQTAAELRSEGLEVAACHLDVTDETTIDDGLAFAETVQGPLHALVNCAGITGLTDRRSEDVDVEDFDRVYRINLRGAFLLS